jgi:hypothetical protein
MGCSITKTRSLKIQHHSIIRDPNRMIEDNIITQSRLIKTVLQISKESQFECGISDEKKQIIHRINKALTEIIILAELSTSLGGKVLNEFLTCCSAINFYFPVHDETLQRTLERARMRIEDKIEGTGAPIVLRLSEMNKFLLESQRCVKISTRTANSTVVIQSPSKESIQLKSTRLKRLFIVNNKLSTSPNSDMEKSQCSQRSLDFGFFDDYDSPCDMRCSAL